MRLSPLPTEFWFLKTGLSPWQGILVLPKIILEADKVTREKLQDWN